MKVEIRNDSVEVSGYVNAVGRDSRPLRDRQGYFIEQVEPGVFARALQNSRPPMLLNHDPSHVIAKPDNYELKEDNVGLYARAVIDDPEVVTKAKAGKIRGWSFGFVSLKDSESEQGGMRHRLLQDIRLNEVSLLDDTRTPAYVATSVMTRDDGEEIAIREMEYQDVETINETRDVPDMSKYLSVIEELSR